MAPVMTSSPRYRVGQAQLRRGRGLHRGHRAHPGARGHGGASRTGWPLIVIALASLCFAFGTPLYALVFYGLPGGNQVHTPFRWVYPWTICLAALAGLGADALAGASTSAQKRRVTRGPRCWRNYRGLLDRRRRRGTLANGQNWTSLLESLGRRRRSVVASRAARHSPPTSCHSTRARGSAHRSRRATPVRRTATDLAKVALLASLLAVDLWSFGFGFNPASERALLSFDPQALAFLRAQPGLFRIAALGPRWCCRRIWRCAPVWRIFAVTTPSSNATMSTI